MTGQQGAIGWKRFPYQQSIIWDIPVKHSYCKKYINKEIVGGLACRTCHLSRHQLGIRILHGLGYLLLDI